MSKLSAKERMLNALKQTSGYNTFSVKSAQKRFGIQNVAARIEELRKEGNCIYTNSRQVNGKKVNFYRLGTPTKSMVKAAIRGGYSFTA
jgi:hypothetical protein